MARRTRARKRLQGQHESDESGKEEEVGEARRTMVHGSHDIGELEETLMNRWYSD